MSCGQMHECWSGYAECVCLDPLRVTFAACSMLRDSIDPQLGMCSSLHLNEAAFIAHVTHCSPHTFSDDVVAGPGRDALDQALVISQASKQAASQESSHAESISQLQQQAIELSTAAGVPVEGLSSQISLTARPFKGPESKQLALNKLTQLQAMAQQHAAKLQVAFMHQPFVVCASALCDEAVGDEPHNICLSGKSM